MEEEGEEEEARLMISITALWTVAMSASSLVERSPMEVAMATENSWGCWREGGRSGGAREVREKEVRREGGSEGEGG